MKKILLTWYGITDFKSSIGIEKSSGPVLGALLADTYDEVIILGYTNVDKKNNCSFNERFSNLDLDNYLISNCFVSDYSNTKEAHSYYIKWLESKCNEFTIKTTIQFKEASLKHLNDTQGIYEAAMECLKAIDLNEDTFVSLFLSPGTSVMAFVWALAALQNPKLKKRLLASSNPNMPPEVIKLPYEWLEWNGKQLFSDHNTTIEFDVIFHLFGEQRLPALLGINQFTSKHHVFVNSKKYPADCMKQFIGNAEFVELPVDPFNPEEVRAEIVWLAEQLPSNYRVGFNLTGGTKLMYAGALAACKKVNATPFYFNDSNNKIIYLNDFKSEDIRPIENVETFIALNCPDLFISEDGIVDSDFLDNVEREKCTNFLFKNRYIIASVYKKINGYTESNADFSIDNKNIKVEKLKDQKCVVSINNSNFSFKEFENFAQYICGGWFEEYVYLKLLKLQTEGVIKDIRLNFQIGLHDNSVIVKDNEYQEIDIIFTDGKKLFIIECKAGAVSSDHVMKLENITRFYGGNKAVGILATCFPPRFESVQRKIENAKNIHLCSGENIVSCIKKLIKNGAGNE